MAKIKATGLGECLANMKDYKDRLLNATPTSLKKGGLHLQRLSQKEVPVATGALKNSAFTREVSNKTVHVGYTQVYSVYVHERLDTFHPVGRSKFLTDPMEENLDEIVKIIAREHASIKPRTT